MAIVETKEPESSPDVPEALISGDSTGVQVAVYAVVATLTVAALYFGQAVILPVVVAVLGTYALEPVVRQVMRLRIPRFLAAMITMLALCGGIGFVGYRLRYRALAVVESLPLAAQELGVTKVQVENPPSNVQDYLWSGSSTIFGFIGQATIVTFLVYFLLASGDLYKRKVVRLIGDRLWQKRLTVQAMQHSDRKISAGAGLHQCCGRRRHVGNVAMDGRGECRGLGRAGGSAEYDPLLPRHYRVSRLGASRLSAVWDCSGHFAGFPGSVFHYLTGRHAVDACADGKIRGNQPGCYVRIALFCGSIWGVDGTLLAVPIMMGIRDGV
ncbi:MAG: hypothetical protein ABI811_13320 [Acidobacteriota bacterium]